MNQLHLEKNWGSDSMQGTLHLTSGWSPKLFTVPFEVASEGEARIRVAVFDLDGTLTVAHGDVRISCCAVKVVRLLESIGVRVSIITGNSLPVALGVAKYLGATGPVAAENGCVVAVGEDRLVHVCRGRPPESLIRDVVSMGFRESWQNAYRYHEAALIPLRRDPELVEKAIALVESRGFKAVWSGYALHIQPPGGGKLEGLKAILRVIGASRHEALVVGDGDNDVEMLEYARFSGAPGDASPRAKNAALYVARLPGALGVAEIVESFLGVSVGCRL
jgi:phosphoglycolate phosphatase (TIGR01487 family)